MSRLPNVGGDDGTWGGILNDFLEQSHNADGSLRSTSVSDAGAEMVANKDTDGTLTANSDDKYPSQKAVKTYVDTSTLSASNIDTDGTLAANSDTKVASQKATKTYVDTKDGQNVKLTGNQTVAGVKTFSDNLTIDNSSGKTEITGSSGAAQKMYSSSSDNQPSISFNAGGATPSISLGSGGSTAPDVTIQRIDSVGAPAAGLNTFVTDFNSVGTSGAAIVSGNDTSAFYTYNGDFATAMGNNYSTAAIGNFLGSGGGGLGFGPSNGVLDTLMWRADANVIGFNDVLLKGLVDPVDAQDAVTKHYLESTTPTSSFRYASILQPFWDGLKNGTANTLFFGDSITYGFAVEWNKTYPQLFNTKIASRYGGTELSWLPAGGISLTPEDIGRGLTATGTPTMSRKGLGSGSVQYTKAGDSQTWTTPHACTVVEVWYKKGPSQGNLQITVDGGTPVVIDTGAASLSWGNKWTSSTLSDTVHTVKVEAVTGGVYNSGYDAEVEAFNLDPDTTPKVYNASRYGAGSSAITQAYNPSWDDSLDEIDPRLVVVHLGTNDLGSNDPAAYQSRLESLLDRLDSLPSGAPAVVIPKIPLNSNSSGPSTESAMQPWWDVVDNLVTTHSNVIAWDLPDIFGDQAANIGGLMYDGSLGTSPPGSVHPSPAGNAVMANSLGTLVLPPHYNSSTIIGEFIGDITGDVLGSLQGNWRRPSVVVTGSRDLDNDNDVGKILYYSGSGDITLTGNIEGVVFNNYNYQTDFVQVGSGKINLDLSAWISAGTTVIGDTFTSLPGDRLLMKGVQDGSTTYLVITKIHSDALTSEHLDPDNTLSANSDEKIATQKAIKKYVDTSTSTNIDGGVSQYTNNLNGWFAKYKDVIEGTGKAKVLVIGDSISSFYGVRSWPGLLHGLFQTYRTTKGAEKEILGSRFPNSGALSTNEQTTTTAGTYTQIGAGAQSTIMASGDEFTQSFTGDAITITYGTGAAAGAGTTGGIIEIYDGPSSGAVIASVDASSGGTKYSQLLDVTLPGGVSTRTVTVKVTGGTGTLIEQVVPHCGTLTQGVDLRTVARFGYNTSVYLDSADPNSSQANGPSNSHALSLIESWQPDLIINALGQNDATLSNWSERTESLYNSIFSLAPDTNILTTMMYSSSSTPDRGGWIHAANSIADNHPGKVDVLSLPVSFGNLDKLINPYGGGVTTDDGIHPSKLASYMMMLPIAGKLLGDPYAVITYLPAIISQSSLGFNVASVTTANLTSNFGRNPFNNLSISATGDISARRGLFSTDVSAGGNLTVTGSITATSLTGNVTGNLTGKVSPSMEEVTTSVNISVSQLGKILIYNGTTDITITYDFGILGLNAYAWPTTLIQNSTGKITIAGAGGFTASGTTSTNGIGQRLLVIVPAVAPATKVVCTLLGASNSIDGIDDLSDVDTSTVTPNDGQALVWSDTDNEWQPGSVVASGDIDTDGTLAANSDTKVASQKAAKTYVDTKDGQNVKLTGNQTVAGDKTFSGMMRVDNGLGAAVFTGYLGGFLNLLKASADTQAAVQLYAGDSSVGFGPGGTTNPDTKIKRTGVNQLDFGSAKLKAVADPTDDQDVATKKYVDDNASGSITENIESVSSAIAIGDDDIQTLTLTGDVTITLPTPTSPRLITLTLIQDATGSRTVTWPTMKWAGGTAPTLSTAANSIDVITLLYSSTGWQGFISGQAMS